MQQRGSGVIGHVSARPGIDPDPGNVAYGVSQAALIHQRRTLDVELSPQGIRVNVVVPQLIATEKNKAMFPPDAWRRCGRAGGGGRRHRLPGQRRRPRERPRGANLRLVTVDMTSGDPGVAETFGPGRVANRIAYGATHPPGPGLR